MNEFGKRLQLALNFRGKRPIDLAVATGISKGNISMYISGKRPMPKLPTIQKIANYLDVLPTFLMGLTDQMVAFEGKQLIGLTEEQRQEVIIIKELISEIQAICSYEDVENLKVILNVVRTLARHNK